MSVAEDVEKLTGPVLQEAGIELVLVEFQREPSGMVLRFYMDKEGGFSLADCETWNDRLGQLIEENNLIPGHYSLEISSPGLNRPIRKRDDFQRFIGLEAIIKLSAPQNGQKNFHGKMTSLEGNDLMLYDRSSGAVKIPLSAIASAKLDLEIEP